MNRTDEFAVKCSRVRELAEKMGLDAVLIGSVPNFAWLTCGGANYVGTATQAGSASVLITKEDVYVLCDNIEHPRICEEELADLNLEYVVYPWHNADISASIRTIFGDIKYGSDQPIVSAADISAELKFCRYPLLKGEIERYRELGKIVSKALEQTARELRPGATENQTMAQLNRILTAEGIVPTCTLAAFDERILKYRHPLPTDKPLEQTAMLITGARKWGLIVSVTRVVSLGKPSAELREKHRCVTKVDASFIASTRPGADLGKIFESAMNTYAECGFPNEWRLHHQGGMTGYEAREFKVCPQSSEQVQVNTAYAWNPSITGTKSEDTILVLPENNDIITQTDEWQKVSVQIGDKIIERPDILTL